MKRAIYFALLGVVTTVALAAAEPFKREETIEVAGNGRGHLPRVAPAGAQWCGGIRGDRCGA